MRLVVGCSGWSYRWWKGEFYPRTLSSPQWLAFYAQHLKSVEINNSFYRMPTDAMVQQWLAKTPPDFRFAVKAWRMITHIKRLKDCTQELETFTQLVNRFGDHVCAVAFQLPPNLAYDLALLDDFLAQLALGAPCAIEFRHESWFNDRTYALLEKHQVALCESHLRRWLTPRLRLAPFAYLRMHGTTGLYTGGYGKAFLQEMLEELRDQKFAAAYVYFNNTDRRIHAVLDAELLTQLADQ